MSPRSILNQIRQDIVLQNSLYIMASTVVMAVFGLIFWSINARLFSTEQVGLGASLIAIVTYMSTFSQLGFDSALVRFLPGSKTKHKVIDTSLVIAGLSALTITTFFVLLLPFISPKLAAVMPTPLASISFIFAMVLITNNTLTDSIFIAFQDAKFILWIDVVLGMIRIVLPFALVTYGAFGLFAAHAGAVSAAALLSMAIIVARYRYRFKPVLDRPLVKELVKYSTGTYLASLGSALPLMVLPILVTNQLGTEQAAYFYAAMTIANFLLIVPHASASSLLAHSAKADKLDVVQLKKTVRQGLALLAPGIVSFVIGGGLLLHIFGPSYTAGGFSLLRMLALSALLVFANALMTVYYKLHKKLGQVIAAQILNIVLILSLFPVMAHWRGLDGVGITWIIGQIAVALTLLAGLSIKSKPLFKTLAYAVGYNVQLPVNLIYAFGSLSPYIVYAAATNGLGAIPHLATLALIVAVTTYCYVPTYIINDWFDQAKDKAKGIRKTHAAGLYGWAAASMAYLTVITAAIVFIWWINTQLAVSLLVYLAAICALALVHTLVHRTKVITIFIQRFFKFCAPWIMIYIAMPHGVTQLFLVGALAVYPTSFMMDHAYKGYFRDRLKISPKLRLWVYAGYWLMVLAVVKLLFEPAWHVVDGQVLKSVALYVCFYYGLVATARLLSDYFIAGSARLRTQGHHNYERSNIMAYGLVQLAVLVTSLIVTIFYTY